jgi:hypothetical protein
MARREIMKLLLARKRITILAALLASAVGLPASISAIPTDAPNFEGKAQGHAEDSSLSSVWDQSEASSSVVTVRPSEPPPAPPERALSANPLWEIPLKSLSGTRERPVFSPSRRPPPAAIASAPPPKVAAPPPKPARVERPQLSLVGTVAGEEASFGIFVDQTTKAALRLKLGEDYQGWKLLAVKAREVSLQHDQQTAVLTLPQPGTEMPSQLQTKVETAAAPKPPDPVQREPRR